MEQHPVPQNISSYEFRLVGDMTLKQFFQLAGGVVIGIFFYRLPIITIVRFPLVFISVVTGVLMAFVPLQGRPFTQWIVAFIRAIYSPTEFTWRPPTAIALAVDTSPQSTTPLPVVQKPVSLGFFQTLKAMVSDLFPHKLRNVSDSLPSTPVPPTNLSKPLAKVITPTPTDQPPPITKEVPSENYSIKTPSVNPSTPSTKSIPTSAPLPSPTQTTTSQLNPQAPKPDSTVPTTSVYKAPNTSEPQPLPSLKGNQTVFEATPAPVSTPQIPPITTPEPTTPNLQPTAPSPAPQATVSTAISTPTSPNILSGIVLDSSEKILSSATIEIVDSATGIPVRALRSNRVGQFQIAIPLPNGSYILNIEKEGHVFNPVAIKVADSIIPPVMIKARTA